MTITGWGSEVTNYLLHRKMRDKGHYSPACWKKSVLCRNLTRPAILAEFIFTAERDPAAVVAVEMWEPAFCTGFQAPG